jgi:hypothetical protein
VLPFCCHGRFLGRAFVLPERREQFDADSWADLLRAGVPKYLILDCAARGENDVQPIIFEHRHGYPVSKVLSPAPSPNLHLENKRGMVNLRDEFGMLPRP